MSHLNTTWFLWCELAAFDSLSVFCGNKFKSYSAFRREESKLVSISSYGVALISSSLLQIEGYWLLCIWMFTWRFHIGSLRWTWDFHCFPAVNLVDMWTDGACVVVGVLKLQACEQTIQVSAAVDIIWCFTYTLFMDLYQSYKLHLHLHIYIWICICHPCCWGCSSTETLPILHQT